jgi:hypothetical protein
VRVVFAEQNVFWRRKLSTRDREIERRKGLAYIIEKNLINDTRKRN